MATLAFYAKLGFNVKNHFGNFRGLCKNEVASNSKYCIRPMGLHDVTDAANIWFSSCGYSMKETIVRSVTSPSNPAMEYHILLCPLWSWKVF